MSEPERPGYEGGKAASPPHAERSRARKSVVSHGDTERVGEVVDELSERVERGLHMAKVALGPPAGALLDELIEKTDLPELRDGDALIEVAARLDREADLWRNLAMRSLAQITWVGKVTRVIGFCIVGVDLSLGVFGAFLAMFGGSGAFGRALLLALAAGIATVGAGAVAALIHGTTRTQRDVARSALARADVAEARLQRVGIALAWRGGDARLYQDALVRLERDIHS